MRYGQRTCLTSAVNGEEGAEGRSRRRPSWKVRPMQAKCWRELPPSKFGGKLETYAHLRHRNFIVAGQCACSRARPRARTDLWQVLERNGGRQPGGCARDWPSYKELSARVEQTFDIPLPMARIILNAPQSSPSSAMSQPPPPRADSQAAEPRPPSRTDPVLQASAPPQSVDADGKGASASGHTLGDSGRPVSTRISSASTSY